MQQKFEMPRLNGRVSLKAAGRAALAHPEETEKPAAMKIRQAFSLLGSSREEPQPLKLSMRVQVPSGQPRCEGTGIASEVTASRRSLRRRLQGTVTQSKCRGSEPAQHSASCEYPKGGRLRPENRSCLKSRQVEGEWNVNRRQYSGICPPSEALAHMGAHADQGREDADVRRRHPA